MSCEACRLYWEDVEKTKLELHNSEFERDRKRDIHLSREEVKALHEDATRAEEAHAAARDRWQGHRATHDD
jgi:hypothetical protein